MSYVVASLDTTSSACGGSYAPRFAAPHAALPGGGHAPSPLRGTPPPPPLPEGRAPCILQVICALTCLLRAAPLATARLEIQGALLSQGRQHPIAWRQGRGAPPLRGAPTGFQPGFAPRLRGCPLHAVAGLRPHLAVVPCCTWRRS